MIYQASLYWMLFPPGAAVFLLAGSVWSIKYKRPLLTLVIRAKKNKDLKNPKADDLKKEQCCFAAYERFVMLGGIALGLLQLISLKFEDLVWKEFQGFLRTKSRSLPSERTVKSVMGNLLIRDFFNSAPALMMRKIQAYCFKTKKVKLGCQRADLMPESELTDVLN